MGENNNIYIYNTSVWQREQRQNVCGIYKGVEEDLGRERAEREERESRERPIREQIEQRVT